MKEQRNEDTSAIEGLLIGLDTMQLEDSEEEDELMMVSHVTAQEGPA